MRDNCTIPTKEEGLAVALSADFLASHLPGVMAGVDKDCQKKIISRYLNASAELQPPVSRCPPDSKDSGCFKFREGDQRLLRALEPYLPKGGMSPEALSDCLAKTGDLSKYFTALDISVASAASCAELLAGESRNIDADVGTGLPAHYRLTKNSDGSFGADLNLRFSPSARQEEFAKTANGCLKKYDSLFKAPPPASGQLHLRVTDEPAGNPAKPPPPTAINITDEEGFRANSENWPSTIDCQTITHELLHKLGLVDEYAEKAMGHVCNSVGEDCKYVASGAKLKEYDCRKEGPEDSIMTDQNAAIDKAQGQPMSGSCTCDSKMNAKRCEKLLNTIPANAEACPKGTDGSVKPEVKLSGFFEMSEDSNPADSSAGAKEKNSEALSKLFKGLKDPSDPKRTKVLKYRKPGSGTIFLPAQFRALTTPGCMATNARLYTCSKAAYSTSLANIGDGCPKGLPDYCDHPAEWTQ
jgi:hypothetical protein